MCMGRCHGTCTNRCGHIGQNVTWYNRLLGVGDSARMGHFKEDIHGTWNDDDNVGESYDKTAVEQDLEEVEMDKGYATTDIVAL